MAPAHGGQGVPAAFCHNLGATLSVGERALIEKQKGKSYLFQVCSFHHWCELSREEQMNWHLAKNGMFAYVQWFSIVGDDDRVVDTKELALGDYVREVVLRDTFTLIPCENIIDIALVVDERALRSNECV